jgi:tetratricopeptide (TPR) repeat protein
MIVTDLSQSPDVVILSTDRLFQILRDLHRQNDPVVSFDTVQEIARRAGVRHVLLGSYVKSGDTIRITATLQEASTGEILRSEHIDATGEANLFPMVDDLTQRIKTQFATAAAAARRGLVTAPGTPADADGSRRLVDVTTSSPEAYRLYAQALEVHQSGRETEAARLYEQAIAIDSEFALAMTRLAIVYGNLGQWDLRERWAKRALDHADRLSQREHLYVEGSYYSYHDETLLKAIESYKKLVAIYHDDASTWNNLGVIYADYLNNLDEAIVSFEAGARLSPNHTIIQTNLSKMYARAGQFEKSRAVLTDFLAQDSRNASIHRGLAAGLFTFDALDEASAELDRADAIDADVAESLGLRWVIAAMRDSAASQASVVRALQQSPGPFFRFLSTLDGACTEAYAGRTTAAIGVFDGWLAKQPARGSDQTAILRTHEARFLLALGKPALALTQATRATAEAKSTTPGWDSAYFAVLALSRLGRDADAAKALDALQGRVQKVPGTREQRNLHWLRGAMALDHGRAPEAVAELRQADALLTPRGTIPPPPIHVRVWFDLGRAYLAARDDAGAAATFEKIVTRSERALYPIEYVRSLYFLGQIAERRGDADKARQYYQRFIEHWGSGDVDPDRVADAKRQLR